MKKVILILLAVALAVIPMAFAANPPYSPPFNHTGNETFSTCGNWSSDQCAGGEYNVTQGKINFGNYTGSGVNELVDPIVSGFARCEYFAIKPTACNAIEVLWSYERKDGDPSMVVRWDGTQFEIRNQQSGTTADLVGFTVDNAWHSIRSCVDPEGNLNISVDDFSHINASLAYDQTLGKRPLHFGFGESQGGTTTCAFQADNWIGFNTSTETYADSIPPVAQPLTRNAEFTLINHYGQSTIRNITLQARNATHIFNLSTQNGTIYIDNRSTLAFNLTYNLSFTSNESGGYLTHKFPNINITDGLAYQGFTYQAILTLNASEIITNTPLTSFNASTPIGLNTSNSSGYATLYVNASSYNISGVADGYLKWWYNISISNLQIKNFTIQLGKGNLTIKAKDAIRDEFIQNFTITFHSKGYGYTKSLSTLNQTFGVNNNTLVFQTIPDAINLSIDAPNFALDRVDLTLINGNLYPNYTFMLATMNSVNFTILDEITKQPIIFTGSNDSVFINIIGAPFSQNYSTKNGSLFVDLLEPSDYRIEYHAPKYTRRDYYISVSNRSNQSVNLYLLSTTNSTNVIISLTDEFADVVDNATIKMLRYYVDTNSYTPVAMTKTDSTGKGQINLELYNGFYYFILEKNGITLKTTTAGRIVDTTLPFNVFIGDNVFESRDKIQYISHELTFNNQTGQFRFTYNDPVNILEEACLRVQQQGYNENPIICNSCSTALSGTILCTVNLTLGGFTAYGTIDTATENSPYILETLSVLSQKARQNIQLFGEFGAYLASYVIMALALLGLPFPQVSLILSIVGLIITGALGILGISYVVIVSIIILASLIVWRLKL